MVMSPDFSEGNYRLLSVWFLIKIPFIGDILGWNGIRSAEKDSMLSIMKRGGTLALFLVDWKNYLFLNMENTNYI